ncbi:helix-turn-helix transcriptional regulator [Aurantimonas sp. C2-6-R+9]|uniref:helix-turn-helix domain-containing protein n=1 Tax=unclassified Aurantimonas TaxID=2638230 RepID=UPI002E19887C|nr:MULTISPECIES: helix-turn-helix transcriptional regulator [unclassified Aurantimonas]MEC5293604.1 helix-turn-helix transcriptional regulator [Aurantimonas sp. C2-3-R2]MEC5383792.1 helix-turn-helix transcriptional regulator [Aurantimonas sp. C2-6-R+9]MEC5414672.1 helix-turn-helix transcriptional regulator [Aurantimonas sp. C2-4-R8]
MDIRGVVGLNVQRLRRKRDISQEELSLRSGCTRGYLSGIETGRRNPTVLFLASLAKALESDVSEFFVRPAKVRATRKGGAVEAGESVKKSALKAKRA